MLIHILLGLIEGGLPASRENETQHTTEKKHGENSLDHIGIPFLVSGEIIQVYFTLSGGRLSIVFAK
jgi:hypothetical protein